MVHSRGGTFTPTPAQQQKQQQPQSIVTGVSGVGHSPHGSHHGPFSAGASPSTNSPTGANQVTKIAVAQALLLLGSLKEDKDRNPKWEQQTQQLRKLINENGMEVFQRTFSRLVVLNAPQIFRSGQGHGSYPELVNLISPISQNVEQARKIAESIETANEDVFRDFDLSTFMEHFKLDALEKTILALAFKIGSRPDLRTKSDAILSTNFQAFLQILAAPQNYADLPATFIATIIDRFIQEPPPSFNQEAKNDLATAISYRYQTKDGIVPTEILAALYLRSSLSDNHELVWSMKRLGSAMTADEETCRASLRNVGNTSFNEEQVGAALIYATISQTPSFSVSVLALSLRNEVPAGFSWAAVVSQFDQPNLRITSQQFLNLYSALLPLVSDGLDIQRLWGGKWTNSETQLSFIGAFLSLSPEQLDATTIPGLRVSFTRDDFAGVEADVAVRADYAARHPLVSTAALSAMFNVALGTQADSDTFEAKRLFQGVVVPNLDIFLVSAFGVPQPWPDIATDTIANLFERFVFKADPYYDFVLEGLWRRDKTWVASRLSDMHAKVPLELDVILSHAQRHKWLDDLTSLLTGFGLDLAALAHARLGFDLEKWARGHVGRPQDFAQALMTFLTIKSQHELDAQRSEDGHKVLVSVMLPVKTISTLLRILEDAAMPKLPELSLIIVQRQCITAYPRLINYGGEFDDIIDANGRESNSLPVEANEIMEDFYKRMYSQDLEPKEVVDSLAGYKRSREPLHQDVFACMIHGLFDEYSLYGTYPLEALATTAVLFGGIIQHKLISDLPLEIGLYMILEAVRDHLPDQPMFKFGLQALMQLRPRLHEWRGFCEQLVAIPTLQRTDPYSTAEEIVRIMAQEQSDHNGIGDGSHHTINGGTATNGNLDQRLALEHSATQFASLHVDNVDTDTIDPSSDVQEKIQFVLNNVTADNIEVKFNELKDVVDEHSERWFAGHLVEERAKMQPNYHELYLDIVKLFGKKTLWASILRETYVASIRLLNSEATIKSTTERTHLKNLGIWLGSLTLARDKAIKHKNIAFKQLLIEAHDTHRLIAVIPFVCKILAQGKYSTIFKPPNPWVMDIIHFLIELYHHGDLKLNLRFEIEVLCTELELDHRSIEPSQDLVNRLPVPEESIETAAPEIMDRFDNMSLNGIGSGVGGGRFSPQEIASSIPDLGPDLHLPPGNDMVNQTRLHEIATTAIMRAVQEIIAPVVERSVTIAAISTAQMIHKDFAIEPDADRVEAAAINMVKKTAGSLALVTSKEPLRASMTNYMRALSQEQAQGLPEGTIIMCVNQNLDLACAQVERKAEERAVPEIKEMIEPELERRRQHRLQNPNEPYVESDLNRWSWTIPQPYKLQPNPNGLNQDQMAIYDEFARQPRSQPLGGTGHIAAASDATRSMANEILQDQQYAVPSLATPATETPALPHINNQHLSYSQGSAMANGRLAPNLMNESRVQDRIQKTLLELQRATAEVSEQHFRDLQRHQEDSQPVFKAYDELLDYVIKTQAAADPLDLHVVDSIGRMLFGGTQDSLLIDTLVDALYNLRRISSRSWIQFTAAVDQIPGDVLLNVPLATALLEKKLISPRRIDFAASRAISLRKEGSLSFFSTLLDLTLIRDNPSALFADFVASLEAAWQVIMEDETSEAAQQLKQRLMDANLPHAITRSMADNRAEEEAREQMEYVLEEWVGHYQNPNSSKKSLQGFVSQTLSRQKFSKSVNISSYLHVAIDTAINAFENQLQENASMNEAYEAIDALAKYIAMVTKERPQQDAEGPGALKLERPEYLNGMLSIIVLVLNQHHVIRGESFNQKAFCRLVTSLLYEINAFPNEWSEPERQRILLNFARFFQKLKPRYFPGFFFAWLTLVKDRHFMPQLLRLPDHAGWEQFALIMDDLLSYAGELLKHLHLDPIIKSVYQGVLKFLLILQHDFPEFVAAHHSRLCAKIPSNCAQLLNVILDAKSSQHFNVPDPLQPGLKIDRIGEVRDSPDSMNNVETHLRRSRLLDILDQALQSGPSEDIVAHVARAVQIEKGHQTGPGFVPLEVDRELMDALVIHIGMHAIAKAEQSGNPTFIPSSPDAALLSMLAHELRPQARYFFLSSIVNQLRFPNAHTHYFSQALLEIFGTDLNDQEEADIREQILRLLVERLIGQWPQPWGVVVVVQELVKNEKYNFYEQPTIKSYPEVGVAFSNALA